MTTPPVWNEIRSLNSPSGGFTAVTVPNHEPTISLSSLSSCARADVALAASPAITPAARSWRLSMDGNSFFLLRSSTGRRTQGLQRAGRGLTYGRRAAQRQALHVAVACTLEAVKRLQAVEDRAQVGVRVDQVVPHLHQPAHIGAALLVARG